MMPAGEGADNYGGVKYSCSASCADPEEPTIMRLLLPGLLLLACLTPATAQTSLVPSTPPPADVITMGDETGGQPNLSANPSPRADIEVDYVLWFLRPMHVPPLLTTGAAGSAAILGDPGTALVYGDDRLQSRHDDRYNGIQVRGEWFLDDTQAIGVNGSAFFLERDSSNFTVKYQTISPIARPYVDATDGSQKSYIVAGVVPGVGELTGGFNAYSRIELFGEDLNAIFALLSDDSYRVYGLLGGRFLQMRERLDLTGTALLLPAKNILYGLTDHIHTFDKFFGVQTGVQGEWRFGAFSVSGKATVALGADAQEIDNKGDRIYQTPFERLTQAYGLYVLPSNSGTFQREDLDVVTEVSLTLGWDLTRWLSLHVGYSLIMWNNPVRPGEQIQPVNLTQVAPGGLTGPALPGVPFKEDFFWAHGGHAGLELRW